MKYKVGDIVKGVVTGTSSYGIFIETFDYYKGLIHISEVSNYYVKNILDYVSMGEVILCEVLEVNNKERHLKLSIKNIDYKLNPEYAKIKDTKSGFKPLEEALPGWIEEKLKEIEKST